MASLVTPVSYLNISGTEVPPYGCVDLLNDCDIASTTNVISVKATTPGGGSGVYAIDSGKGTGSTGSTAYGQFFIPSSAPVWAYYTGDSAPGTAWVQEVGPHTGGFDLISTGTGFLYAGVFDAANERILVISKSANTTDNGGGGGGTGGGGCGCCDCTKCLDMCAQNKDDVVQTCSTCSVAPRTFTVDFGAVMGWQDFVYVSDCTWETDDFRVYYRYPFGGDNAFYGLYKGTFIENGLDSTLEINHSSGTDVMKLSTARQLRWTPDPDKPWSCFCNMRMVPAVSPDRFPPNLLVPCEACIAPVDAPPVPGECSYLTDICIAAIAFDGMDATGTLIESYGCDFTINGDLIDSYSSYCSVWGLDGPAACCGYISSSFQPCQPDFATSGELSSCVAVCADSLGIQATIIYTHDFGTGVLSRSYERWYRYTGTLSEGDFVLDLDTLHGGATDGPDGTWPATLTVTLSDCSFAAANPDYGFGCGYTYGNGGGGAVPPCTGSCAYVWVHVSGEDPKWAHNWSDSNCAGEGCFCHEPGISGEYLGQASSGTCST